VTWTTSAAVAFTIYLVALSAWDLRRRENPWWATTPLIVGLAAYRICQGPALSVFGGWLLATLPYVLNTYGAADYRLLLVTWGLFPTLAFAFTLGIGMVVLAALALALARRPPLGRRPSRADLLEHGQPGLFVISLPALCYVWAAAPLTGTPLFH